MDINQLELKFKREDIVLKVFNLIDAIWSDIQELNDTKNKKKIKALQSKITSHINKVEKNLRNLTQLI